MAEVSVHCSVEFSWVCEGCGEHLFGDGLYNVTYEEHVGCYHALHGRHLPGIALTAGYSDVYSFMASKTEVLGHIDYTLVPAQ